jgi:hypothetical protein
MYGGCGGAGKVLAGVLHKLRFGRILESRDDQGDGDPGGEAEREPKDQPCDLSAVHPPTSREKGLGGMRVFGEPSTLI